MNCYTVGTVETVPGISMCRRDEGWFVLVGHQKTRLHKVPIGPELSQQADELLELLQRRAKNKALKHTRSKQASFVRSLSPNQASDILGHYTLSLVPTDWVDEPATYFTMEVTNLKLDGEKLDYTSNPHMCFVHVLISGPNPKNSISLVANSYCTRTVAKRNRWGVVANFDEKVNNPLSAEPSVKVLAMGLTVDGTTEVLVGMNPGNGFRIRQSQPCGGEDAWKEMSLVWNGFTLKTRVFS